MKFLRPGMRSRSRNEAIARAAIDLRSAWGGRRYRKFVIVGTARTGSTLLLNLLNASRHALAFGELFRGDGKIGWDIEPFLTYQSPRLGNLIEKQPLKFLDREVFRRWPGEVGAVGFKLFYYHARTGRQAAVWDMIRDDPDLLVIHIKRVNMLEQYLSLTIAHATDVWSASDGVAATPVSTVLDPLACRLHFEELRVAEEACDAFFAGRQIETLTYEDLVADKASVMARLRARLGLPFEQVEPRIVRQRTHPLTRAIANYEELRAFFSGSDWERLFRLQDTAASNAREA